MQKNRGFTLIELLVVLAIVALLLTLALPRYLGRVQAAKEAVLTENLRVTRDAIDKFNGDRGRYPTALSELVETHYLRSLPYDPVAETFDWKIIAPSGDDAVGIEDIKSTESGNTVDGRDFSSL